MGTWFKTDLHVHTCLSPCADLSMSPRKIVAEVLRQHIEVLAITDHNSAANVRAVMKAAQGKNVVVLPGMEVCTKEEAHVLAIFGNVKSVMELQKLVYQHLKGRNDPDVFGLQVLANAEDEVEGFEDRLLIGATELTLEETVDAIHQRRGLAIASHIDRESFSVIGQLGFIPEGVRFDALEFSANISHERAGEQFSEYSNSPFIRNSDAHFLADVGKNTTELLLEEPTFAEVEKAIKRNDGRFVATHTGHC
jgi:predicted metal-dependent phosphoesterase TrpH